MMRMVIRVIDQIQEKLLAEQEDIERVKFGDIRITIKDSVVVGLEWRHTRNYGKDSRKNMSKST